METKKKKDGKNPGNGKKEEANNGTRVKPEDNNKKKIKENKKTENPSAPLSGSNATPPIHQSNQKREKEGKLPPNVNRGNNNKTLPVCQFFLSQKGCYKGNECNFAHPIQVNNQNVSKGQKKDNSEAKKDQNRAPRGKENGQLPTNLSPDMRNFLQSILKKMQHNELHQAYFIQSLDLSVWKSAIEIVANSNQFSFYVFPLLLVYLALTDTATNTPNIVHVLQLVIQLFEGLSSLDQLKLIIRIFEERLTHTNGLEWINQSDKLVEIERLLARFEQILPQQLGTFSQRFTQDFASILTLFQHMTDSVKRYKTYLSKLVLRRHEAKEESAVTAMTTAVNGWYENPTIEWLVQGTWYEQTKLKTNYESVEDYVLTMQKLWTQLSFYWGLAAFWPKCRCSSNSQANATGPANNQKEERKVLCNAPLLCPVTKLVQCSMIIKNKGRCEETAEFMCANQRGHDTICRNCIRKKVYLALQSPSQERYGSSTDVYDAIVRDTRNYNESLILNFTQVQSRKPPEVAVNWKTSYRLQPACLVAVVLLHSAKATIPNSAKLYWGEIIVRDHNKDDSAEYQRRGRGELTVRLLSKHDSELISANLEDPFKVDSYAAVIDFRVFVPEVFSVLSTLSLPTFTAGLQRLSFKDMLLQPRIGKDQDDALFPHDPARIDPNRRSPILQSILLSKIPGIQRLSEEGKNDLYTRIQQIPLTKTLDRTQLKAFCKGLSQDFHCTLGPPGTGKSYVGVCLVLALHQLRKLLISQGQSVGPIVTLSYKNHALDEFLKDVKDNCPDLLQKGRLIRIGKPELEELQRFSEKSSIAENQASVILDERIQMLRKSKQDIQSLAKMISAEIPWKIENLLFIMQIISKLLNDVKTFDEIDPELAYEVIENIIQSDVTLLSIDNVSFVREVEHWNFPLSPNQSRYDLLFQLWLSGNYPPPRCIAFQLQNIQCRNCSSEGSQYCVEIHRCQFAPFCANQCGVQTRFCEYHGCGAPNCTKQRLSYSLPFCEDHLCPLCIDHPKESKEMQACNKHTCKVGRCTEIQIAPFHFCLQHMCRECTKEGQFHPAANQVPIRPRNQLSEYCSGHKCGFAECGALKIPGNFTFCINHSCLTCGAFIRPNHQYCENHRCAFEEGCDQSRVSIILGNALKPSQFCIEHTCSICVQVSADPLNPAYPPRNTCFIHPLCAHVNADGVECNHIVEEQNGSYCEWHIPLFADGKCNGITKKRLPCKSIPLAGELYCKDHKNQDPGRQRKPVLGFKMFESVTDPPITQSALAPPRLMQQPIFKCVSPICNAICVGDVNWNCYVHGFDLKLAWPQENFHTISKESDNNKAKTNAVLSHLMRTTAATESKESRSDLIHEREDYEFVEEEETIGRVQEDLNGKLGGDEVEIGMDLLEEEQENEERKHFKQVFQEEVDDDDDTENEQFDLNAIGVNTFSLSESLYSLSEENFKRFILSLLDYQKWDWKMIKEKRESLFADLLKNGLTIFKQLIIEAEKHVDAARRAKAEANALAFKQAAVIGGTIVGAAKRLRALRGAEPFAIIVEEACEVMEPTLVSVLAVESLQKLELIGDQRQLPAFIQNCWYNIEISNPTIKRSLFERMVENEEDKTINPDCTLLDVQRRMRASISALTKQHYRDVVKIIDHEKTMTQKVGDRLKLTPEQQHIRKDLWTTNGRLIPGIQSTIFFWNMIENKESRPKAGLSACNESEALAVAALVKYLLLCGVPPGSITILTPYQGQKRELISILRKEKVLTYNYGEDCPLLVSTVDRYQGDENDIIILSLVRSRPGNRFVSLLNRFIVASSRARLGFYIIGSVQAVVEGFQDPSLSKSDVTSVAATTRAYRGLDHWKQFVVQLQSEHQSLTQHQYYRKVQSDEESGESSDNIYDEDIADQLYVRDDLYPASRVSSQLPICCPQHSITVSKISSKPEERSFPTKDLWSSFCKLPCQYSLRCGHLCSLPCHFATAQLHNSNCQELVNRPCTMHAHIPLHCHAVTILPGQNLTTALRNYPCEISVLRAYENCSHSLTLSCHEWTKIDNGLSSIPKCEEIVDDFIQPRCGHLIKRPKCYERQAYERNPPNCMENVNRNREKCGHRVEELCHKIEEAMRKPCQCSINQARPRCGHPVSMRCYQADQLIQAWNTVNPDESIHDVRQISVKNEVYQDRSYGPAEQTLFRGIGKCEVPVDFVLSCEHLLSSKYPCHQAFAMAADDGSERIPECNRLVKTRCKLCEREIQIPCHRSTTYELWDPFLSHVDAIPIREPNKPVFIQQTKVEQLNQSISASKDQQLLWKLLQSSCKHSTKVISYIRSCNPNHTVLLACEQMISLLLKKGSALPACKEIVPKALSCGHEVKVECSKFNAREVLCQARPIEPYIYPDCGHTIILDKCYKLQKMINERNNLCEKKLQIRFPRCGHVIMTNCYQQTEVLRLAVDGEICREYIDDNLLLVKEDGLYCQPCETAPLCKEIVVYQRRCNHRIQDVVCSEGFKWAIDHSKPPPCRERKVLRRHPLCFHAIETECRIIDQLQFWEPWKDRQPPAFGQLQIPTGIQPIIESRQLAAALPFQPCPLPIEDRRLISCNQPIFLQFPDCVHVKTFPCTTLFERITQLSCEEIVSEVCSRCGIERQFTCTETTQKTRGEREQSCLSRVIRRCQSCQENEVDVPCNATVVHCMKEVRVQLPCLHEGVWICGKDDDLRGFHDVKSRKNLRCVECNIDLWREIMNVELNEVDLLKQYCLSKITSLLPTIQLTIIDLPSLSQHLLDRHTTARLNAIRSLIQAFSQRKCESFPPPPFNPESSDLIQFLEDHYEVVYLEMDPTKQPNLTEVGAKRFATDKWTGYSNGLQIHKLTKDALQEIRLQHPQTKSVRILLGLAFHCKILKETVPFAPLELEMNQQQAQNKARMSKLAAQTKQQYCLQGYDCVEMYIPPPRNEGAIAAAAAVIDIEKQKDIQEYVFWLPNSAIATNILEFQLHTKCIICADPFPKDPKAGAICAQQHFVCWDCFSNYVTASSQPDAIHSYVDEEGNLTCPCTDCRIPYVMMNLVRSVPSAVGDQLIKLKLQLKINQERAIVQKEEEAKWQAELKRINEMNEFDREVHLLRLKIIEEIFTLRCPRCKVAYLDFDGCSAVTCSQQRCKAGFCGWCEQDCGDDAHGHATNCRHNPHPGDIWGTPKELQMVRNQIRSGKVQQLLRNKPENIKNKLKEIMQKDFADLRLPMNF